MSELRTQGVVRCTQCFTPHHRACFLEHGRCTQMGCESRETTHDRAAEASFGWELHPFLATETSDHEPRFLSVRTSRDPAPDQQGSPRFRLELPDQVGCGELLEGTLRVFVPRALRGRGLRLLCRSDDEGELTPTYAASAVLAGAPPSSWLEGIRLAVRGEEPLLSGGKTTLSFKFDPSPFPPRTRLPDHPRFGVYHALVVRARLESRSLAWESRPQRVLVRHRPGRCGHRRPRDPWPEARLRE